MRTLKVYLCPGLVFRCNKDVWYVMELCQYGPVSDIASALVSRGRRLIEDQIAYIIKETLHALIYLQHQLVCHRDVKGSNILLTEDCQVKLVDYGISCQVATEVLSLSSSCHDARYSHWS